MGVPKWKTSKRKVRTRKANSYYKMDLPKMATCNNCGKEKLPHVVCPHCGYYKGKQVITVSVQSDES